MTDLWPSFLPNDIAEESHAVELLEEQAKLLYEKTGGKVRAKFVKAEYKTPMKTFAQKVSEMVAPVALIEEPDLDIKDKIDVNELYEPTSYFFEIYNDTYHFRVFTLKNRIVFPVQMVIDEGIWEELSFPFRKQPLDIENNEELEDVVRQVLGTKKLRSIVNRLMDKNNNWTHT